MKRALVIEMAVFLLCVVLVSALWPRPLVLTMCPAALSAIMLHRWHTKKDVLCYGIAFVIGPLGEIFAVRFGAWEYGRPLYLIPVWLPLLWGVVGLFLKRFSETLLHEG